MPTTRPQPDVLGTASLGPFRPLPPGERSGYERVERNSPRPAIRAQSGDVANGYLPGSDCGQAFSTVQVGADPNDLLQGFRSEYGAFNNSSLAMGDVTPCSASIGPIYTIAESTFFEEHGTAGVARSTDGGHTWTDSYLGNNTTYWAKQIHHSNGTVSNDLGPFGNDSLATGIGQISGNANGSVEMYATTFESECINNLYLFQTAGFTFLPCDPNVIANATEGVAVSVSTDGGRTWGDPAQLANASYFVVLTQCGSYGIGNVTDAPSVTVDPATGDAVVMWDVDQIGWLYDAAAGQCYPSYAGTTEFESTSTDAGVSWSAPRELMDHDMQAAVSTSPGTGGQVNAVAIDPVNSSITAGAWIGSLQYSRSTNGGTTWSTPREILSDQVHALSAYPPPNTDLGGNFLLNGQSGFTGANTPLAVTVNGTIYPVAAGFESPTTTVDNWSGSPYYGRLYVAWADNGSSGIPGIDLISSSNNGSTWSGVTGEFNASRSQAYYEPSLSVDSLGRLWLSFLALNVAGTHLGNYTEEVMVSSDGGASFTAPFPVADTLSSPGSGGGTGLLYLGGEFGMVATSNGTFVSWTDARLSNVSSTYDSQVYLSHVFVDDLATNATTLNFTTSTYGQALTLPATSLEPGVALWAVGATHTVTVPGTRPYNASAFDTFQGFSGLDIGDVPSITFTTDGAGTLTASYVPSPGAILAGQVTPDLPSVRVYLITASSNTSLALIPGNGHLTFSDLVPGGVSYGLYATAGALYTDQKNASIGAIGGQTTTVRVSLSRTSGFLTGRLSFSPGIKATDELYGATRLALNASDVPINPTDGLFNVPEPWGQYELLASNPRTSTMIENITVEPGAATGLNIVLSGGWIDGSIVTNTGKTGGASVTLNGSASNVSVTGQVNYNVTALGGWYWLNATEPGFNQTSRYVHIVPGTTLHGLNLDLTDQGWIMGYLGPAAAISMAGSSGLGWLALNASTDVHFVSASLDPSTGSFNMTVQGDLVYTLTVRESGYSTLVVTGISVAPGRASIPVRVTLQPTSSSPQGNCSVEPTHCTPRTVEAGPALSTVALVAAGVGGAVVLGVVLLWYRQQRLGRPHEEVSPADPTSEVDDADQP